MNWRLIYKHCNWLLLALICLGALLRRAELHLIVLNNHLQILVERALGNANCGCSLLNYSIPNGSKDRLRFKKAADQLFTYCDTSLDRMLANAARAYYLAGIENASLNKRLETSTSSDPLIKLLIYDLCLVSKDNLSVRPLPNWIWSGSIFLDRAKCLFNKHDCIDGFENLEMFLKIESNVKGGYAVDKISELYPLIKRYCTAHQECDRKCIIFRNSFMTYLDLISRSNDPIFRAKAHYGIGHVCALENMISRAISNYEIAVREDPKELKYRINMAAALSLAGKYQDAEVQFAIALKQVFYAQDKSMIMGQMGYMYLNANQFSKAAEMFEKSINLSRSDASYEIGLGRAYWSIGRSDDAIQILENIVRDNQNEDRAWIYLGIIYRAKKQWNNSLVALKKAINIMPFNVEYRFELASMLLGVGLKNDAIDQLRAIVRLDPNNVTAIEKIQELTNNK